MFISKSEKLGIEQRLFTLEEMVKSLYERERERERIRQEKNDAAKKKYEEKKKIQKSPKTKRSISNWTPEARAIQGERVRLMWAEKRAAKSGLKVAA
jgi:flagellar biosynthesis GTPase FlhF